MRGTLQRRAARLVVAAGAAAVLALASLAAPVRAATEDDGRTILYTRYSTAGWASIRGVSPVDGSERVLVDGGRWGRWSPDGRRIAYVEYGTSKRNAQPGIWVAETDGSSDRRVVAQRGGGFGWSSPDWSPDGSHLAYSHEGTVYLVRSDGGEPRPLTAGFRPSWSPDGRSLVFTRDVAGVSRLHVVDVATGAVRTVPSPGAHDERSPDWSPDGQRIVFFSSDPSIGSGSDVFTVRLDGSERRNLTGGVGSNTSPAWSADGSHIAFVSTRDLAHAFGEMHNRTEIFVMRADGTDVRRITSHSQSWPARFVTISDDPHWRGPVAAPRPPSRGGYCAAAGTVLPDGSTVPAGAFLNLYLGQPETDERYRGARLAIFVDGAGLTCDPPPPGFAERGLYAGPDAPAGLYRFFAP